MRREMFEELVDPAPTSGTHRWYTVPLSIVSHAALAVLFIVLPLTAGSALPSPETVLAFAVAPPPPPHPVAPPEPVAPPAAPQPVDAVMPNPAAAPLVAPDRIGDESPSRPAVRAAALPRASGLTGSFASSTATTLVGPPPPARPVPVGGAVRAPTKVHHVPPVYPAIARASRSEGLVIIEATIASDGAVRDARILRSSPMFDQAALDAVRQWRYTPPTLNGLPVDVTMTVTVQFLLN